jgi:molybdopterin-dependent oxidoreductase alpha subunit
MEESSHPQFEPYKGPAGGWGSVQSLASILKHEQVGGRGEVLAHQNRTEGFACVSCAWAKPEKPHLFEFCENGAKATAWEITQKSIGVEFFAEHTLTELEGWSDYSLEDQGRLTVPLRWDASSDRYLPVSWQDAFSEIGAELRALEPKSAVFYASGRASLETSYLWALMARLYGNNNLPDSSNMCHESTSVGLKQSIGVPVGTVSLQDFEFADCIFFFGQNVGSNSPRLLHDLQAASRRGVPIITFNPLRERGLEAFKNPQSPKDMLIGPATRITSHYHQLRAGGDSAAILGISKAVIEMDDAAAVSGGARVVDVDFIAEHTTGFDEYANCARGMSWNEIETASGLTREALIDAAQVYVKAERVICVYGMGLTQHRLGVQNVRMVVNLLLMRGNIGRPGAGVCPVRGHSNVQGQRTVGITEKPEMVPVDKLRELFAFEAPKEEGLNTVEACEGIIDGSVRALLSLGGNFLRAVPETTLMEPAWRRLRLSVQIATKLNRSHVVHGKVAYLLPCLGRIDIDRQASGEQAVAVEDSTGHMHGSRGRVEPPGPQVLSEPAIVGGIAKALLPPNPRLDWDGFVADYSKVRELIAYTYPDIFHDFNSRLFTPGGFARPLAARNRIWQTASGKAEFRSPKQLDVDPDMPTDRRGDVLRLITLRSNDQFNTTIYGYDDRFRGIRGTRLVLLMNRGDIEKLGLSEGDRVTACTHTTDGVVREVAGLLVTPYDIPAGCCAGYYPECNPLIPLWHHAEESKVPAAKSIPIVLRKMAQHAEAA